MAANLMSRDVWPGPVTWGRPVLAALLLAAGALLASGRMPGSATMAPGPRVGMGAFLLMAGFLLLAFAVTPLYLRATTRPEDYEGGCPVGARCSCGHFNLKPRRSCRECGAAMAYPA